MEPGFTKIKEIDARVKGRPVYDIIILHIANCRVKIKVDKGMKDYELDRHVDYYMRKEFGNDWAIRSTGRMGREAGSD